MAASTDEATAQAAASTAARAREPGVDFERNVFCVMGLPIDALNMDGAVRQVRQAAFSNTRCFVSTPNLNFLMAARRDVQFRNSVLHSNLSLADGMPLVWVARLLGLPIRERVSGAGLFEHLQLHPGPPLTVFFFGGPSGAAEAACRHVNQAAGGLRCLGYHTPGFDSVEEMSTERQIDQINRSGAQFVVVSLGARKGQAWIENNRARLHAPVLCHLGAVVNFAAGTLRRAPPWMQALGAEWLWRIQQEPSLWRRYWNDCVSFLHVVLRHVLPLAMHLRWGSPSQEELGRASVTVLQLPQQTTLELRGAWTHANLAPLRRALLLAQEGPADVALGLKGVTHVDSAFLGLLLLAQGALGSPRRLLVRDATPRVATIFNHCGAAFLLAQHPQQRG